jgi:DNA-cytosine methyltransferase
LSEGFIRAGYTPLAHIEMDKYACDTLKTRSAFHWLKSSNQLQKYKKYLYEKQEKEDDRKLWEQVPQKVIDTVIQAEIGEKTIKHIFKQVDTLIGNKQVDIIVGGPPCQAYSVAGRARMGKTVEKDPRNELYKYYVKFLEHYQPKMFVFENVTGIFSTLKGEPLKDLKRLVKEVGYEMDLKVQTASEHGVLQNRQRVIIVGWKKDTTFHYPELAKEENKYEVLKDLFIDLPERKHADGQYAFIENIYEPSPLNRVIAVQGQGKAWQDNPVQTGYQTNTSPVNSWRVNENNDFTAFTYAANQLYITQATDENGNVSRTYKDKQNRVVMSEIQYDTSPPPPPKAMSLI